MSCPMLSLTAATNCFGDGLSFLRGGFKGTVMQGQDNGEF